MLQIHVYKIVQIHIIIIRSRIFVRIVKFIVYIVIAIINVRNVLLDFSYIWGHVIRYVIRCIRLLLMILNNVLIVQLIVGYVIVLIYVYNVDQVLCLSKILQHKQSHVLISVQLAITIQQIQQQVNLHAIVQIAKIASNAHMVTVTNVCQIGICKIHHVHKIVQ
jgi:hypothetical protein